MADAEQTPLEDWTEDQVRDWLRSLGIKKIYIDKIYNEEVNGKILLQLDEDFLANKICQALGPAFLILKKRDELIKREKEKQEAKSANVGQVDDKKKSKKSHASKCAPGTHQAELDPVAALQRAESTSKEDCKPRPFDKDALDFIYVKNRVLLPESGAFDLISPCHEYKSFALAATLDRARLQAKFAYEVLRFATGCMNVRTNGTIHFGVMDSREDAGYVHGEIIGVPVSDRDIYVDALEYIDRCFTVSEKDLVRQCVRPPRFIEVMDRESPEKRYVVEVDIVPLISVVKNQVFSVRLPKFNESSNKVQMEKALIYRREGSKTTPVSDTDIKFFFERTKDRDALRDEAEKSHFYCAPGLCKDLGRKLTMLMTSGKKFIDKSKWFILVTNKLSPADLSNIDWLLNLNIFCVFDFDPDSRVSGLCRYLQDHVANMHSLQSYSIPTGTTIKDLEKRLNLFEQTSWIFPNARSDFDGDQTPCDEKTWFKTKMHLLRKAVSLICEQIIPKGAFQVIFLLTSAVEKPLLHTFNEFYTDMEGHEDIVCICESEENFSKWQAFVEGSCGSDAVDNNSVVGLKMSHVDAILQQVQPLRAGVAKHLPVAKGTCTLTAQQEETLYSLEILLVNHCEDVSPDFVQEEKENIEQQFYRGGRVTWMNFWLADKGHVGEVIERDAYDDVSKLLEENLKWNSDQDPVVCININHHPGSGGSTVARQVLWKQRRKLRCAVVKPDHTAADVAQHAVELRLYEEKDPQRCLPVLLLIEDADKDYVEDLKYELQIAMNRKKIRRGKPCFVLLICRRSHDPEGTHEDSPLKNVSVTRELSEEEKERFDAKLNELKYRPDSILTFVLMSEGFSEECIEEEVESLLEDIDHESPVSRLMHYAALLNTYVPKSYIPLSHCEAFLKMTPHDRFSERSFMKSLSDQAGSLLLLQRDHHTHIESVRIIHPLVAEEVLNQLSDEGMTQSRLASKLLKEPTLFRDRSGRDESRTILRALFTQRLKKSKGDKLDSRYAPFIEHVHRQEGGSGPAAALLQKAYQRFQRDPFIAQHLARLHYYSHQFQEAERWAEDAAKQQPFNSFILDTKGQVYKRWFQDKCKDIDQNNVPKTADSVADAVKTALKAIKCFQDSQQADLKDMNNVNNSGYFAEVEVGCNLLKLIHSIPEFSNWHGHSECMKYLVTDYIPHNISRPWKPFHASLKKLHQTLQNSLEWISEDLSYFQEKTDAAEEETSERSGVMPNHSHTLLMRSKEFGQYCSGTTDQPGQPVPPNLTLFQKQMMRYQLGGGTIVLILSKLIAHSDGVHLLEKILSLYPSKTLTGNEDLKDIVCYITAQISLNCLSPQNDSPSLEDLQMLCKKFPADLKKCPPGVHFLSTLLFWPDDQDSDAKKEANYEKVLWAVVELNNCYKKKMKNVPQRGRRLDIHFFLGKGSGLDKFVHKLKLREAQRSRSVSEKLSKEFAGEPRRLPHIAEMLKPVPGWTNDGAVYLAGPRRRTIELRPLPAHSVPHGNEEITFNVGFTFRGLVALNISRKSDAGKE